MPQAGQSMEEGTITKWIAQVGETIKIGQVIFEVETDKATIEVESDVAGRLARIVVPEGETVAVKTPVAYLADNDADVDAALGGSSGAPVAETTARPQAVLPADGSVIPVVMPQAGQSMEEGTITKWIARVGESIKVGQIIFEVETDKATIEVESDVAGTLAKIVVPEGETVAVKTPVAYLADDATKLEAYLATCGSASPSVSSSSPSSSQPSPAVSVATVATVAPSRSATGRIKASPAAKKAAQAAGFDLAALPGGTGPGGRIVLADLAAAPKGFSPATAPAGTTRRPLKGMRKAIAKNLTTSKQTIPHFYLRVTINAEAMMAYYKAAKPATGCTVNDVVALAAAKTSAEFPGFRTRLEGDDLVEYPAANVGVAVGLDDGLVVPVIVGADKMSLAQLAAEARRIVELARNGKTENMGRGTMTISNMGMFGVEEFAAIINPPEALLLAVAAVREAPVVRNGQLSVGKVMTMTLSADHRVVDGVMVAKFAARLKEILEKPDVMG
ncbi:MAG: 2-oxo acid dehydrogenase subunit E2 [Planctomycetota bacterium]|nr:2-oxo acid dehydrogenase subunit E2 [Planctomycetota bacterium]